MKEFFTTITNQIINHLNNVFWLIVLLTFGIWFSNILKNVIIFYLKKRDGQNHTYYRQLGALVSLISKFILVFIALLIFGIDKLILLTLLGMIVLFLSVACISQMKDLISGIIILAYKSIQKGDLIEIDGLSGHVIDVQILSTKILGQNEKSFIIPNHIFTKEKIVHASKNEKIRIHINFKCQYYDELSDFIPKLNNIAFKNNNILLDPPLEYQTNQKYVGKVECDIILTCYAGSFLEIHNYIIESLNQEFSCEYLRINII